MLEIIDDHAARLVGGIFFFPCSQVSETDLAHSARGHQGCSLLLVAGIPRLCGLCDSAVLRPSIAASREATQASDAHPLSRRLGYSLPGGGAFKP